MAREVTSRDNGGGSRQAEELRYGRREQAGTVSSDVVDEKLTREELELGGEVMQEGRDRGRDTGGE